MLIEAVNMTESCQMLFEDLISRIAQIPQTLFEGISFDDIVNSRQQAIMVWALFLLILSLAFPNSRQALHTFLKSLQSLLKQPVYKLLIIYQLVFIIIILLLNIPEINFLVLKDYFIFYYFTLIPYLVNVKHRALQSVLFESIGLAAAFQFLLSAYTLSFWLELIVSPFIVLVLIIGGITNVKGSENVRKFLNLILFMLMMTLLMNFGIHFVQDLRKGVLSLGFLEGYLIEPITWIASLPLILLSIPMMQFDNLDSFRTSKKSSVRVFLESVRFLFTRESHRRLLLFHPRQSVEDVHIGGVAQRKICITIRKGTSITQIRRIQSMYQWMLAPSTDYKDGVRVMPIRVESRIAGDTKLVIDPYEVSNLEEDYKLGKYGL